MRSKLTSRGRTTIPIEVRRALGLEPGDIVSFELHDNDSVTLRANTPGCPAFAVAISELLKEWDSEADNRAFANL